ncbi:MAG: hypothetical protein IPM25_14510 [Chloracidobacterium sp.]|nr:hypothetical protein [Chloracidobacterium sp.]
MSKRLFNFWFLPVILSMAFSAVAACACSHHGSAQKPVEAASCHGPAHADPSTEADVPEPTGDAAEADCECLVRKPVPAISAKPGNKKAASAELAAEPTTLFPLPEPAFSSFLSSDNGLYPEAVHKAPPLDSGPSRAPPRL